MYVIILYIKATVSVCLSVWAVPGRFSQSLLVPCGVFNYLNFWPPGVCLHWGGSPKPRHGIFKDMIFKTWDFSFGMYTVWVSKTQTWNFLDMIFRTWDPQFLETWSLHSGFPRPKKTWEILGYGFQDMVFKTWDLNFGAWIFTLAVSKTETWKLLGCDFQDVGSQFWHMIFRTWMGNQATSQCRKVTGTH
jgi:hypothetical protein